MNESLLAALLFAAVSGPAATPPAASAPPGVERLTVRRAVQLALARAPEVAVARSAAEEARAGAEASGSARRPQLYVSTTPGYSTGLPLAVAGEVPAFAGAALRMTLYDAGLRDEELRARARAAGLEAAVADARAETVRRVAGACAKLSADESRAAAAGKRLEARERILSRARSLSREGRLTDLEVERAGLEEARARQKLLAAESDRDLDRYELASLTGLPPSAPIVVEEDPADAVPEPPAGDAVTAALAHDAGLAALSAQAEALEISSRLLSRAFQPAVNAEARYAYAPRTLGYDRFFLRYRQNVASLGVSVQVPVLSGGRDTALAAKARAHLERIRAQRRARETDLALRAREAEAAVAQAGVEAGLARRAAALAQEALSQARALAREGRGDADGVDRAELALADAREEEARAGRRVVETRLLLLALRGDLLGALGAEPAP